MSKEASIESLNERFMVAVALHKAGVAKAPSVEKLTESRDALLSVRAAAVEAQGGDETGIAAVAVEVNDPIFNVVDSDDTPPPVLFRKSDLDLPDPFDDLPVECRSGQYSFAGPVSTVDAKQKELESRGIKCDRRSPRQIFYKLEPS